MEKGEGTYTFERQMTVEEAEETIRRLIDFRPAGRVVMTETEAIVAPLPGAANCDIDIAAHAARFKRNERGPAQHVHVVRIGDDEEE